AVRRESAIHVEWLDLGARLVDQARLELRGHDVPVALDLRIHSRTWGPCRPYRRARISRATASMLLRCIAMFARSAVSTPPRPRESARAITAPATPLAAARRGRPACENHNPFRAALHPRPAGAEGGHACCRAIPARCAGAAGRAAGR